MKTSNKIIIAFSVFIVGSIVTLFSTARGHEKYIKEAVSKKSIMSKPFSVVVAEDSADVHINYSENYSVDFEYIKDKKSPSKLIELKNDTLHIYKGLRAYVNCKNIKSVIGRNHYWMGIYKFAPELITFNLSGGNTYFDNGGIEEKPFNIDIKTSNQATFNVDNVNGNKITVESNNGNVDFSCKINSLHAKLQNNSRLEGVSHALNISVERDSTSSLQ